MMYWQKDLETMSRDQLAAVQLENLKKTVANCYGNVPYYRAKLDEMGLSPADILRLEDVRKLPITKKRRSGQLPLRPAGAAHARRRARPRSSGTTGKPTMVRLHPTRLRRLERLRRPRRLRRGATSDDVVQISFGYGLFTALGTASGLGEDRRHRHPAVGRQHRKTAHAARGPRRHRVGGHPLLRLYLSEVAAQKGIVDKLKLLRRPFRREAARPRCAGKSRKTSTSSPPTTTA